MTEPAQRLLTVDQVAARCQLHPKTVRRAITSGRLTALRLGRRAVRVRPADVEAWLTGAVDIPTCAPAALLPGQLPLPPRTPARGEGRLAVTPAMGRPTR